MEVTVASAGQSGRPVIVGKVSDQITVRSVTGGASLLERPASEVSALRICAGSVCVVPLAQTRVDGLVVGVQTDVVVTAEANLVARNQMQRNRRQRQHRSTVSIE